MSITPVMLLCDMARRICKDPLYRDLHVMHNYTENISEAARVLLRAIIKLELESNSLLILILHECYLIRVPYVCLVSEKRA